MSFYLEFVNKEEFEAQKIYNILLSIFKNGWEISNTTLDNIQLKSGGEVDDKCKSLLLFVYTIHRMFISILSTWLK